MPTTHTRTCNLCEAMCGLLVTVDGGRIVDIRGDHDDVLSRGHICPKGPALREVYEDPDRLRHPMRRTARGWERVGWNEALDEAAKTLRAIQKEHGRDSIGLYVGNPTVHNHGAAIMLQGFARALRSRNKFDANSQDANPKLFACMMMYGDQLSVTLPDVDRTDYLLMLGANPAASNGSIMTLGDVRGRIRGIRERGGRVVLVDPRRTESADWADEHLFIRPGGDAPLLLAILHVLFASDLVDAAAVEREARGLSELRAIAARFAPERVTAATGIAPEVIRRVADEFGRSARAVAYGRVGTCHNEFSSLGSWLVEALNVASGNFDRPGGAMFATPAVDTARVGRKIVGNSYARWRSRVRGLPEFGGQLPGAVMAEEMETPGEGQLRGFVCFAGNPVLSTPSGERLSNALSKLEYFVAVDFYLNETTRHAHLILPPVHALERSHFDVVFHTLAVRNTVKWSAPVMPRPDDSREDWEILYELGMRMGGLRFGIPLVDQAAHAAWRAGLKVTPDRIVDLLLRAGPYGDKFLPFSRGLNLDKVKRAPHGIDLGPLMPARAERVRTADKKVDLVPEVMAGDLPRLEKWIDEKRDNQLVLIGRRHVRTNNSWMHNCRSLVKGPDRAALLIHPDDARRLTLAEGQTVRVQSRAGEVTAHIVITDDVMPGVVSLPHGYGHAAIKDTMKIAGAVPGPNINAITDAERVDPLTGTAVLTGVPVTISPVSA